MPAQTYYLNEGKRRVRVPSVTTVLKYAGDKGGLLYWHFQQGKEAARLEFEEDAPPISNPWQLPKTAADIGTIVHLMIECDVHGIEFDRSLHAPNLLEPADVAFKGWLRWKANNKFDAVATELKLVSALHRYGGTQDLTMIHGERTLMDYKTSKAIYPEHIMQAAAYVKLWEENRPDEPIEAVAILRVSKGDGSFHHHSWSYPSPTIDAAWEGFKAARVLYDVYTKHLKDAA